MTWAPVLVAKVVGGHRAGGMDGGMGGMDGGFFRKLCGRMGDWGSISGGENDTPTIGGGGGSRQSFV